MAIRYREKFLEVSFNLRRMEESFRVGDGNYQHYLNSFLSSAQSVFFCLNKEFNRRPLYDNWRDKRSDRLPLVAKIFKELRNISEKEAPVRNSAVVLEFDYGAAGITIPAHATVTSPAIDSYTGRPLTHKATITTKEGISTEVEPIVVHDFIVTVVSHGKTYRLDKVISDARLYTDAILREIEETERKFLRKSN